MFTRNTVSQKGFSLIETLVGVAILVFVGLSLFTLFDITIRVLWESKARAGAQELANEKIELAHNVSYTDVGTIGGIPAGTLPVHETVLRNSIPYSVTTTIVYIDDPFDGTLGGNPNDILPSDYKRVRIEVAWPFRLNTKPVVFLSDIVPQGIESEEGGGTLRITVLNAFGLPVPQAQVHIENNTLSPVVNIDLLTNDSGRILLPGAPAAVESYEIIVTKSGYSTDSTYAVDPVNLPTPIKPPITVADNTVTDATFAIDILSALNMFAFADTEYTPAWWDENYSARRRLTVQNSSTALLEAGYTVMFNFDHYTQVQQGDALGSGDDVRVLWFDGSSWVELDRIATTNWNNSSVPTTIRFKTQSAINSNDSDDNYFLYYGNSAPSAPFANAHNVYQFYDDFSNESFTYGAWATSTNTWVVESGEYHQTSTASGITTARAGPATLSDYLVHASLRSESVPGDLGVVIRANDESNFYVAHPFNTTTALASRDAHFSTFGGHSFVQATDTTLALFTAGTTGDNYYMYTSIDRGASWQTSWSLSVPQGQYGHSVWLDSVDNTIYVAYTEYDSGTAEYQVRLIVLSYDGGTRTWTPSVPLVITAHSFAERAFRPRIIKHNGELIITYARFDSDNNHEIASRISTDNGSSWSSETWLTDWNVNYASQDEWQALEGQLAVYNNEVTVLLNGARMVGWRQYDGVSWSAYTEIVNSSFHNRALSTVVTGTSPSQELQVIYRNGADSGTPHHLRYNGSWQNTQIVPYSSNFSYAVTAVGNELWFYYSAPNDTITNTLYLARYVDGVWQLPLLVYNNILPVTRVITPQTYRNDSVLYSAFVAGVVGSEQVYINRIATTGNGSATVPVAAKNVSSVLSSIAPVEAAVTLSQVYTLEAVMNGSTWYAFTNGAVSFIGTDSSFTQGQLGLFANNTNSYFDTVYARLYVTPEPTVLGNLEETFSASQPLPNLPVTVRGNKRIGYDSVSQPVYKFDQTYTTDANGRINITFLEWDAYNFYIDDSVTGYDLTGVDPPDPVSVNPNTTQQVNLYFTTDQPHSLRVSVLDVSNQPIEDVDVRVYDGGSYDTTLQTFSYGQVFFAPLTVTSYTANASKTGFLPTIDSASVNGSSTLVMVLVEEGGAPPPGQPPTAPTFGSFTNIDTDRMQLNWTDNATNEDGYRIYRNTVNTKPGTPIIALGANSELYPAAGLTCNTPYYWWSEAYNTQGSADDTASQSTTSCIIPPTAPTFGSFTNIDTDRMQLNWTDNATNEDGYRIYRNTVNTKPGTPLATLSADTQNYLATGLTCDITYYWWSEAYNAQGSADDSTNQATLTCPVGIVFYDTFTTGSDTELSLHAPDIGNGWTQIISVHNGVPEAGETLEVDNNDWLQKDTCGGDDGALYQTNDVMVSADYDVSVIQINGDNSNDYNFVAARIQDANNMYAFKWNESDGQLYKRVSGSWQTLGSQVGGIADGSTVMLKVEGTSIRVFDDSVEIISVSDNTHTAAGRAGVGMGAVITPTDDCSSQRLDDFTVNIP